MQIYPNYGFLFLTINLIIYVFLIKSFSTHEKKDIIIFSAID